MRAVCAAMLLLQAAAAADIEVRLVGGYPGRPGMGMGGPGQGGQFGGQNGGSPGGKPSGGPAQGGRASPSLKLPPKLPLKLPPFKLPESSGIGQIGGQSGKPSGGQAQLGGARPSGGNSVISGMNSGFGGSNGQSGGQHDQMEVTLSDGVATCKTNFAAGASVLHVAVKECPFAAEEVKEVTLRCACLPQPVPSSCKCTNPGRWVAREVGLDVSFVVESKSADETVWRRP